MDSMSETVMTSAAAAKTCEKDGSENENENNNNYNSKKSIHETNMTNIRSMALPWGIMVIASIIAASVVISYQDNQDQQQDDIYSNYYSSSSSSQSSSSHLDERFLNTDTEHEHVHVHKPVYEENHTSLFPLSTSDRIGFSFAICGLMLAAGGGIGGGGILVPIYILVMGFSPKHGEYCNSITIYFIRVLLVCNRKIFCSILLIVWNESFFVGNKSYSFRSLFNYIIYCPCMQVFLYRM
jgi:hypothetical protein